MELLSAKQILIERGRGYLYKQKYPQVIIFTRSVMDIDKLIRTFGGHSYKHNTGTVWVLSSKQKLKAMLHKIAPTVSQHHFEDIIIPHLGDFK